MSLGGTDPDHLARYVMGRFDAPAFARRARAVADAYETLLAKCRRQREELLGEVRERLGRLGPVPGLAELERAAGPVEAAAPSRDRRRELRELAAAVGRFNAAWAEFLHGLDLGPVNALRDGYNRYYLLEKECALRSARVAGYGFQPMAMLTPADLAAVFPPLPVPELAD
jgi:hypothetical protein